VGVIEREGAVFHQALEEVAEAVAGQASQVVVSEVPHIATKEAVETVAIEAATSALREPATGRLC
jgi:hypothetical protein